MRFLLLTTAIVSGLVPVFVPLAAIAAPTATERCEARAAHPAEPGRRGNGVGQALVDAGPAAEACEAAVAERRDATNLSRLARAYYAADRFEEARALIVEASRLGDPHATALLASYQINGVGAPADPEAGRALVRQLLEGADPPPMAYGLMGRMSETGEPPDFEESVRYYRLGADGGEPYSMFALGWHTFASDPVGAARWYERATRLGQPGAAYQYALLLETGSNAPNDPAAAAKLYRFAARNEIPDAAADLARLNFYGRGVPKDPAAGFHWAKVAHEGGSAFGSYQLGMAYYQGWGVARDPVLGADLWEKASEAGILNAKIALASVYVEGVGRKRDLARAEQLVAESRSTFPATAENVEKRIAAVRSGAADPPPSGGGIDGGTAVALGLGALLLFGLLASGGEGSAGGDGGDDGGGYEPWPAPENPWQSSCWLLDDLQQAMAGCQ